MPSRFDTAKGNRDAADNADRQAAKAREAGSVADAELYESFAREARRTADAIDRNSA